ncbi:MAG: hypothetical protein ACO2OQ_04675 [Thermofilaceae archaeon]
MKEGKRNPCSKTRREMLRRNDQLEVKVKDLKPNLRWFTITVKILKLNDEKIVFSKKDGDQHRLAEALVGDETGTILMSLWDEDIDKVRDLVGSAVKIKMVLLHFTKEKNR